MYDIYLHSPEAVFSFDQSIALRQFLHVKPVLNGGCGQAHLSKIVFSLLRVLMLLDYLPDATTGRDVYDYQGAHYTVVWKVRQARICAMIATTPRTSATIYMTGIHGTFYHVTCSHFLHQKCDVKTMHAQPRRLPLSPETGTESRT